MVSLRRVELDPDAPERASEKLDAHDEPPKCNACEQAEQRRHNELRKDQVYSSNSG